MCTSCGGGCSSTGMGAELGSQGPCGMGGVLGGVPAGSVAGRWSSDREAVRHAGSGRRGRHSHPWAPHSAPPPAMRVCRPTPLYRARRLEKLLDTPARIYYK